MPHLIDTRNYSDVVLVAPRPQPVLSRLQDISKVASYFCLDALLYKVCKQPPPPVDNQGEEEQRPVDLRGARGVSPWYEPIRAELGGRGVSGSHPHRAADQDARAEVSVWIVFTLSVFLFCVAAGRLSLKQLLRKMTKRRWERTRRVGGGGKLYPKNTRIQAAIERMRVEASLFLVGPA